MAEPSLTTRLQQRANRQPGGTVHTFIDYEVDPAGVAQSLTWAQLRRRAQASNVQPTKSRPSRRFLSRQ
jgi:long-chain fatty acid adenylase/transferase FadD26